ncbi:hypothetical protein BGZ46_006359 [Entomortierella lignicola]|nr:hypothetical protein BGZ46_006359 [Entomortierella lignicola]
MAPIQGIAGSPLSIITTAIFAFSVPNSAPPTDGVNATVWGTNYTGSASYFDLSITNATSTTTSSTTSITSTSSLVYYNTKSDTYTGCDKKTFSPTDNVALMNPLQFGNITSDNSTCGEWIQVQNRENTMQSTYAKIVGICDDCEYGDVDLSIGALSELVPGVDFDQVIFNSTSNNTFADLLELNSSTPLSSMPITPLDMISIVWSLSDPPTDDSTTTQTGNTSTTTMLPTSTSSSTSSGTPTPTKASSPQFSGPATWYSDTYGQCEHSYSQSDLIVAVNQHQMGDGKALCGKKILLTEKGSNVQVVVTVVDMCPGCGFGGLDLSQAAFKKFASLGVGVLHLTWSFL